MEYSSDYCPSNYDSSYNNDKYAWWNNQASISSDETKSDSEHDEYNPPLYDAPNDGIPV